MKRSISAIIVAMLAAGVANVAVAASKPASVKATQIKPNPKKICPTPVAAKASKASLKLGVGSAPPPLKVYKWVKGQPVKKFEKGKVYVVELWATWCGPCRQSIPHLTELAKEYKGKVTFAGVSVWDDRGVNSEAEYVDNITKFVKEQGDNMVYNVGMDDMKGTIAKTWAEAANVHGIPTAFVIGKDGKIVVICHPMELTDLLPKILAGTFDSKAFAKQKADEEAKANEFQQTFAKAGELFGQKKYKETVEEIDRVLAAKPEYMKEGAMIKYSILLGYDESAAYAYARKISEGIYKDDVPALRNIVSCIISNPELKTPDYDLAVSVAEQAAALTKNENVGVLQALAEANFKKGNIDKAIEVQEKAISLLAADSDEQKKDFEATLAEYKSKKDGK